MWKCAQCGTEKIGEALQKWLRLSADATKAWFSWDHRESYVKGNPIRHFTKAIQTGTRSFLATPLLCQASSLEMYSLFENTRSQAFKSCKKKRKKNDCVVMVEFTENSSSIRQAEAQAAYYRRTQVTIHPMVADHREWKEHILNSFVVISDDLKHDSTTVLVLQKRFFQVSCSLNGSN